MCSNNFSLHSVRTKNLVLFSNENISQMPLLKPAWFIVYNHIGLLLMILIKFSKTMCHIHLIHRCNFWRRSATVGLITSLNFGAQVPLLVHQYNMSTTFALV